MYPYNNNDDFFDRFEDDNDMLLQRGTQGGFPGGGPGFSPGGGPGFSPGGGPGFPPGVGPGFPPGGVPGSPSGFPGQPPFGGQTTGTPSFGGQMTPPTAPPPSFTPQISSFQGTAEFGRRSGGRGIGRCFFRNTFIWLTNGDGFWFFPMFAFGNTIIGFRWRGNRGWVYDSINRNRILFFQCY